MTLLGLSVPWFFGILAASVAVVAVLYRLKLRRRTIEVGFARLWRRVVKHRPATSLMERFRQLLSFLLQTAFVFLVLAAIARPRLSSEVGREGRFVIVLDASGRMQARMNLESDCTRFDEAVDRAKAFVRRLGDSDRTALVLATTGPTPVTVFECDRRVLLDALDRAEPVDARSDLTGSVRFARDLAGDRGRVIVFTDAPRGTASRNVNWAQIGSPLENVAITRFAASTPFDSPGEVEVLWEVRNFGKTDSDVTLRIQRCGISPEISLPNLANASLIEEIPLNLGAGESRSGVMRKLAREDAGLLATLVNDEGNPRRDGLALDDRAYAVATAGRVTRVTVVGADNPFLDRLLSSDPLLAWNRVKPDEFSAETHADVVIFDRCAPRGGFPRAIYIRPEGPDSPVGTSGEATNVFVDALASDHPILRYVGDLSDLNVMRSQALAGREGDVTLASCAGTPVMIARRTAGQSFVALGFDLTDSDLVLRVAFPKIFRNAISWLVSGEGALLEPNRIAGDGFPRAGWFTTNGARLAVNVSDAKVSDLLALPSAPSESKQERTLSHAAAGDLWPWLAGCALALTVFEWISYHRRWTV